MSQNSMLKKIGGKLREESRDIVEAQLPHQLRALLQRLACVEELREHVRGPAD